MGIDNEGIIGKTRTYTIESCTGGNVVVILTDEFGNSLFRRLPGEVVRDITEFSTGTGEGKFDPDRTWQTLYDYQLNES